MIKALTLSDFDSDGVSYGFFGRTGGVSEGIYSSLNCRAGSSDDKAAVLENRGRVAKTIGVELSNLLTVYQVHGDEAVLLEKPWRQSKRPKADAMVTKTRGVALGVLTADCTPVLFHGKTQQGESVVGAAHAGWKGAIGGILDETVLMMKRAGALPDSIVAAIGPCIAQESYEVGQEFYDHFKSYDEGTIGFFVPSKKDGHFMFDLPRYCVERLAQVGVERVVQSGVDTYANEGDYFSYRRTTHKGEADYGGQISVICVGD